MASAAAQQVEPLYLPTNQTTDFTVVTPFFKQVDKKFPPDEQTRDKRGFTCEDFLSSEPARVQVCWCYGSRARSITVRSKYEFKGFGLNSSDCADSYYLVSGYHANPKPSDDYLVSIYEVCKTVFAAIGLRQYERGNGFIIVSGSTKSLKSELARGLMNMLLEKMMKTWLQDTKKRKPHLVTCEDNIEQYFIELNRLKRLEECFVPSEGPSMPNFWLCHDCLPDYTPRLLEKDTPNLAAAVDDALRMTPAIFYGGEIRKKADWQELNRLAQSHLVVVTTHSSSIVNTFSLLRDYLEISSPARRSDLASSVLAIVHMRAGKLKDCREPVKDSGFEYVLPSCWVRTPASVTAFASDGLASVVPHFLNLKEEDSSSRAFCIGRRSFAEEFIRLADKEETEVPKEHWFKWKSADSGQLNPPEKLDNFLRGGQPSDWKIEFNFDSRRRIAREASLPVRQDAAAWDLRGE